MKQLQKIHVIKCTWYTAAYSLYQGFWYNYCLRTSNHQVIQLYDVLIIGVIVVSSHTHLGFVCKGMLDTIIRSIRLSIIKHHQVFSYLNSCHYQRSFRKRNRGVHRLVGKIGKKPNKKTFLDSLNDMKNWNRDNSKSKLEGKR